MVGVVWSANVATEGPVRKCFWVLGADTKEWEWTRRMVVMVVVAERIYRRE